MFCTNMPRRLVKMIKDVYHPKQIERYISNGLVNFIKSRLYIYIYNQFK